MQNEQVIIERVYSAPVNKVWDAITDPAKMRQWYFPQLSEFIPQVGFETRFDQADKGKVYPHVWKVTEVVTGKKISYEWKFDGYAGNSLLTMELFDQGDDKTRVLLTHSHLETFKGDLIPDFATQNFVDGWNYFIGKALKEYVENINI